jgi:hypothetical protein
MGTEAVTYGTLCGYECMVGFLKPAPAGPGWCVWYEVCVWELWAEPGTMYIKA